MCKLRVYSNFTKVNECVHNQRYKYLIHQIATAVKTCPKRLDLKSIFGLDYAVTIMFESAVLLTGFNKGGGTQINCTFVCM